jgi:hypothetical protein
MAAERIAAFEAELEALREARESSQRVEEEPGGQRAPAGYGRVSGDRT